MRCGVATVVFASNRRFLRPSQDCRLEAVYRAAARPGHRTEALEVLADKLGGGVLLVHNEDIPVRAATMWFQLRSTISGCL
jgi:hypothetical protein